MAKESTLKNQKQHNKIFKKQNLGYDNIAQYFNVFKNSENNISNCSLFMLIDIWLGSAIIKTNLKINLSDFSNRLQIILFYKYC